LPPPPPRACFGREELIENIVSLVEDLTPIALTGAGGIGKTSIALTVLHQDRIKKRFGDNRRFIRCDQFPPSRINFLNRLSRVIGAGDGHPEDLTPLRPFLSSKEILIVLDNAETILDPQGDHGQEIYSVVEELSQYSNICLVITSRITTIPPDCETIKIPTLSMEAARDTFYRIYKYGGRSDSVGDILEQLDFHPLSVTILATVAHQNQWDNNRLAREWEQRQTDILQTVHKQSLAATIELSLASPMFRELGPDARELLGVVAFFPQGIDENNLDWLFPTIPNRASIFDNFCMLSLAHRTNGFITMLAPLREYLRLNDPKSSSLLRTAKERYFARMSVDLDPNRPEFGDARWIASEDVNVEHLLNVFTSIDANLDEVWDACANFLRHLHYHKPRQTMLKSRIEGLPDDHRSKSHCLFNLSLLFDSIGNHVDRRRLLIQTLELERGRGDGSWMADILRELSDASRMLDLHMEGIQHAREALGILEGLGDTVGQAGCLNDLARSLRDYGQLDAAEQAASRAITLLPDGGQEYLACGLHRVLGDIYSSKGERGKAIRHMETAVGIASPFNWHDALFWTHYSLARLYHHEDGLDDAQAHIDRAKGHTAGDARFLGRAMEMQAYIWLRQGRLAEATGEASRAAEIYEKLGAAKDVENCRVILQVIAMMTKGGLVVSFWK
jgi:tetratricopeptide (TPR) repeat protein